MDTDTFEPFFLRAKGKWVLASGVRWRDPQEIPGHPDRARRMSEIFLTADGPSKSTVHALTFDSREDAEEFLLDAA